jgi:hypothetical protein
MIAVFPSISEAEKQVQLLFLRFLLTKKKGSRSRLPLS